MIETRRRSRSAPLPLSVSQTRLWHLSQFAPSSPAFNELGGLRNPNFKALDGPFAMLAVRHMVVTDYPFLCENDTWMDAYLARFALEISAGCPLGEAVSRRAAL